MERDRENDGIQIESRLRAAGKCRTIRKTPFVWLQDGCWLANLMTVLSTLENGDRFPYWSYNIQSSRIFLFDFPRNLPEEE